MEIGGHIRVHPHMTYHLGAAKLVVTGGQNVIFWHFRALKYTIPLNNIYIATPQTMVQQRPHDLLRNSTCYLTYSIFMEWIRNISRMRWWSIWNGWINVSVTEERANACCCVPCGSCQCCQSSATICDLSIAVAFGHNKLWRPEAANRVSVISQVLWPSAITNSGIRRPLKWLVSWLKTRQMATLGRVRWTQKDIIV